MRVSQCLGNPFAEQKIIEILKEEEVVAIMIDREEIEEEKRNNILRIQK